MQHILDPLNSAVRFAAGRRRGDLDADEMLFFALVRAIEIVGEAATQISPQTRSAFPDLPWSSMIGMRNRLAHAYFDIDREILWTTVTDAAPLLIARLSNLLRKG